MLIELPVVTAGVSKNQIVSTLFIGQVQDGGTATVDGAMAPIITITMSYGTALTVKYLYDDFIYRGIYTGMVLNFNAASEV